MGVKNAGKGMTKLLRRTSKDPGNDKEPVVASASVNALLRDTVIDVASCISGASCARMTTCPA